MFFFAAMLWYCHCGLTVAVAKLSNLLSFWMLLNVLSWKTGGLHCCNSDYNIFIVLEFSHERRLRSTTLNVHGSSHGTANAHDYVQIVRDTDVSCDGVLQALTLLRTLHYCSWKVLFFPVKLPDGQPYLCLAAVVS